MRELYENAVDKIKDSIAMFQMPGSNWRFRRVVRLDINTVVYRPLRGKSYIDLPTSIKRKGAIINMKNEDDQCFKWCITRALNPVNKDPQRITKNLKTQAEELDWGGTNFSVSLSDISTFENHNAGIKVNVFGYDEDEKLVYPLRHSKDEGAIDLLLLSEGEKRHYCWIKNFNRLMSRPVSYTHLTLPTNREV